MVENFLNKKNSTRGLTLEKFNEYLPILAEELSSVDFHYEHTETSLRTDWENLKKFTSGNTYTASTVRKGIKLCEHFFPNFFDIKNSKGECFKDYWNKDDLQKVLKWNRSSHSTPYLSELRRGVYFCNGLTKNTMYRPHIAKMVCDYYQPEKVLDPCCGWGGRLLGSVASGSDYYGFETNTETFKSLNRLVDFLEIKNKVHLFNVGSETMEFKNEFDLVITSPPYFNLEVYSNEKTQSENMFSSYDEWLNDWLKVILEKSMVALRKGGVSCWNVHNIGDYKLIEEVKKIHFDNGFVLDKEFGLQSSSRQSNQNKEKSKKTTDLTMCYRKE